MEKQSFFNGLVNLNAVVRAQTMLLVLSVQLRLQRQKTLNKLDNRKMKVGKMADIIKLSTKCVRNILHEHLHLKKLCVR